MVQQRLRRPVAVREPLVLISEIQRSGGTLLSQLLDGHPQVHAHAHQMQLGDPHDTWPTLDLDADAAAWWKVLREPHIHRAFIEGYTKYARRWTRFEDERLETYPFLLLPSLQAQLFERLATTWPIECQRDVLDVYMTSYFNAWTDNRNLYDRPKRWVTAFSPLVATRREHRAGFFADYPDGRLVSSLREPRSWYGSALAYNSERYGDLEQALGGWRESAQAMIDAKHEHGARVFLVSFERMVGDTEGTMRALARFLDIDFVPALFTPTFNGLPIKANSSFRVERHGVLDAPLKRADAVSDHAAAVIDRVAGDTYRRALELVD